MKYIKEYIIEALKINSKSKVNKKELLEPEDFESMETDGYDYTGEEVVLIGKPFKDENDPNYKESIEYIKKKKYRIWNNYNDIDDKEIFDLFIYAINAVHSNPFHEKEVNCYVYGFEGAYAKFN